MSKRSKLRARELRPLNRASREASSPPPTIPPKPEWRGQSLPPQRHLPKRLTSWFLATMTTIGGAYVIYDFRPKLQIVPTDSLSEHNALEKRFVVTNLGYLSIASVEVRCAVDRVRSPDRNISITGGVWDNGFRLAVLRAGEPATVTCGLKDMMPDLSTTNADISIQVDFDYPLWWRRIERQSRFVAELGQDGVIHWFPQPSRP